MQHRGVGGRAAFAQEAAAAPRGRWAGGRPQECGGDTGTQSVNTSAAVQPPGVVVGMRSEGSVRWAWVGLSQPGFTGVRGGTPGCGVVLCSLEPLESDTVCDLTRPDRWAGGRRSAGAPMRWPSAHACRGDTPPEPPGCRCHTGRWVLSAASSRPQGKSKRTTCRKNTAEVACPPRPAITPPRPFSSSLSLNARLPCPASRALAWRPRPLPPAPLVSLLLPSHPPTPPLPSPTPHDGCEQVLADLSSKPLPDPVSHRRFSRTFHLLERSPSTRESNFLDIGLID